MFHVCFLSFVVIFGIRHPKSVEDELGSFSDERANEWRKIAERKKADPRTEENWRMYIALESVKDKEKRELDFEIIGKDLGRSNLSVSLQPSLKSVLETFTKRHKQGYFQEMAFIAARLLEIGLNEEETFYALAYLIDEVLQDYFDGKETGLTRDVNFIQNLLHYCHIKFDSTVVLVTESSFISALAGNHDSRDFVYRLWDLILRYGRQGWLAAATARLGVLCGDTQSTVLLYQEPSQTALKKSQIEAVISSALTILKTARPLFELNAISRDERLSMWSKTIEAQEQRIGRNTYEKNLDLSISDLSSEIQPSLRVFLIRQQSTTGHVPVMDVIASTLKEIGLSERDTFYALDYLFNDVMLDYHAPDLRGIRNDFEIIVKVLKACEASFELNIADNLEKSIMLSLGIKFVKSIQDVIRLWDIILIHGRTGWLAVAAALLGIDCPAGADQPIIDPEEVLHRVRATPVLESQRRALVFVPMIAKPTR